MVRAGSHRRFNIYNCSVLSKQRGEELRVGLFPALSNIFLKTKVNIQKVNLHLKLHKYVNVDQIILFFHSHFGALFKIARV